MNSNVKLLQPIWSWQVKMKACKFNQGSSKRLTEIRIFAKKHHYVVQSFVARSAVAEKRWHFRNGTVPLFEVPSLQSENHTHKILHIRPPRWGRVWKNSNYCRLVWAEPTELNWVKLWRGPDPVWSRPQRVVLGSGAERIDTTPAAASLGLVGNGERNHFLAC